MLQALRKQRSVHPGYAVAAVTTVALTFTAPGQTMLVSLLNLPLRQAFGIDPLVLNTSYTLATIAAALPLVWVGRVTDRFGPRKMMLVTALAFGSACIFTAAISHTIMVWIAFFLLRFLGQGSLAIVSHHALAMWFHARLGTITGIRQVLLFAIWTPLPAATVWLINAYGWRLTWAFFGVTIACVLSTLAWHFVHDRPENLGLGLDAGAPQSREASKPGEEPGHTLREALRTPAYWILVAAGVLPPMIGTALLFEIQPLLLGRGVSGEATATAVSGWSATMAIMAIPSGRLVDVMKPRWMLLGGVLALAASCLLWLRVSGAATAVAAMATCAIGQSLIAATVGTTAARFFGRRHHGAIRSSLSRLGIIATGLGPLLFGLSQEFTGDYRAALLLFASLCLPAGAAALCLDEPA